MTPTRIALAIACTMALAACGGEETSSTDGPVAGSGSGSSELSRVALSPTPPVPSPKPWAVAPDQAECEGGWQRPPQDEVDDAVALIQQVADIKGRFKVADARTFTGPESPPRDVGKVGIVTRWYVKGGAGQQEGRFLVESRQFGRGVVAVAPYDSEGFRSPDWIGFIFDQGSRESVEGVPGRWVGEPYDFVAGGDGLNLPGLPAQMAACLDGT